MFTVQEKKVQNNQEQNILYIFTPKNSNKGGKNAPCKTDCNAMNHFKINS